MEKNEKLKERWQGAGHLFTERFMLAKEKENQPNKRISSKKAKTNQIFWQEIKIEEEENYRKG